MENKDRGENVAPEPKPKMTRSEVSSMGGRAAHEKGTAHEWVAGTEEHRNASRKGGFASARRRQEQQEEAK